jgi:hypothetical protein
MDEEKRTLPLTRIDTASTVETNRTLDPLKAMSRSVLMAAAVMSFPLIAMHSASAQGTCAATDSSGDGIGDSADPGDCADCSSAAANGDACQDPADNYDYNGIRDSADFNPGDHFDRGDTGGDRGGDSGGGGDTYYA